MRACVRVCVCVCVRVYMYVYVCRCVCVCIQMKRLSIAIDSRPDFCERKEAMSVGVRVSVGAQGEVCARRGGWRVTIQGFVLFGLGVIAFPGAVVFNSSTVCDAVRPVTFKCVCCTTCTLRYSEPRAIFPAHYAVDRIIQRRAGDGVVFFFLFCARPLSLFERRQKKGGNTLGLAQTPLSK